MRWKKERELRVENEDEGGRERRMGNEDDGGKEEKGKKERRRRTNIRRKE